MRFEVSESKRLGGLLRSIRDGDIEQVELLEGEENLKSITGDMGVNETRMYRRRHFSAVCFTTLLMFLHMFGSRLGLPVGLRTWVSYALATSVQPYCGGGFCRTSWHPLR